MPLALILALAASLGIHIGALVLPDMELPGFGEDHSPVLEARLVMPPPQATPASSPIKAAAKPKARPSRSRQAAAPGPAMVPPPAQEPQAAETATAEPPVVAAPPAATPPAPRLPPQGRIRFVVYKGEQHFEVGQSIHEWQIVDGAYTLTGMTETTGLAAFFKPVRVSYESKGKIGAEGLVPELFISRRNGSETGDKAVFDWATSSVTLGKEERRQGLPAGAQDFISLYYEFGYLPQIGDSVSLPVATGRKLDTLRFTRVGEEVLELPFGNIPTLHLKAAGESTTEIWLATDRLLLPVKIRHIDKKGEIFDQIASELRVGDGGKPKE